MTGIMILTEQDLRSTVQLDTASIECVESAFRALASGNVSMPPVLRLDIPEHRGEVDVKTAYVPGLDSFAIKISPGFFNNPQIGLPSTSGMMAVLSSTTGQLRALLLDNGYLTNVRTAAAGAVAAKQLARADASIATVYGAGVQARMQLEALALVRPIQEARVWARDGAKAEAAARELSEQLGFPVAPVRDPEAAARNADVIITTTSTAVPIFKAAWLEPGQHLTAMGSDAEHKNEIEPAAVTVADVYVADRVAQTSLLGELHHAVDAGVVTDLTSIPELGDVIVDPGRGRTADDQVTMADLTGTGIQDTAIASLAHAKSLTVGAGVLIESRPRTSCATRGRVE